MKKMKLRSIVLRVIRLVLMSLLSLLAALPGILYGNEPINNLLGNPFLTNFAIPSESSFEWQFTGLANRAFYDGTHALVQANYNPAKWGFQVYYQHGFNDSTRELNFDVNYQWLDQKAIISINTGVDNYINPGNDRIKYLVYPYFAIGHEFKIGQASLSANGSIGLHSTGGGSIPGKVTGAFVAGPYLKIKRWLLYNEIFFEPALSKIDYGIVYEIFVGKKIIPSMFCYCTVARLMQQTS